MLLKGRKSKSITQLPLRYLADLYNNQDADIKPDMHVLSKEILRPVYGNFINQVISTEKSVYQMNEEAFSTLIALEKSLHDYVEKNED